MRQFESLYWFNTIVDHLYIQKILGSDFDVDKKITWTSPRNGITLTATPDAIHKSTRTIIEIKSTESMRLPMASHLKQLSLYCAITNAPVGKLLYIIGGAGRYELEDYIPEYTVTLDADERAEILRLLETDVAGLGINIKDPGLVSHIATNEEYIDRNGSNRYCRSCPAKYRPIRE